MAAAQKEQIGVYKCWSCGNQVPVKKLTGSGKLAAPCGWCDWVSHYADPGTKHYANLLAATTLDTKPAPAPAPAADTAPPAPPKGEEKKEEKKPARSAFAPPFGGR